MNNDKDICHCDCHEVGQTILHFMPCCNLCGASYLKNGQVDHGLLHEIKNPRKKGKRKKKKS